MDCVYSEMREGGRVGRQAGRWAGGYASENEGMKKSRKQVYLLPYSPRIDTSLFYLRISYYALKAICLFV